jgi:hypothetical protein
MDVFAVAVVVLCVPDTMVREALLPDQERISKFSLGSKRKPALDILQSLLLPSGSSCCPFVRHWKRPPSVPGFPRFPAGFPEDCTKVSISPLVL